MSGSFSAIVGAASTAINLLAVADFEQSYGICPIYLSGGIAQGLLGGLMPITALTQPFPPLSAAIGNVISQDGYFAKFYPIPGATLIDNKVGEYTFASQAVAANAVIAQPLRISMVMVCPAKDPGGYALKASIMIALQASLKQHTSQGGLFTIATPSFVWTNAILERLVDITSGETKQKQTEWQWDFTIPLVTQQDAQMAMNNQMAKISAGVQTDGSSSGAANAAGNQAAGSQPGAGGNAGLGT